MPVLVEVPERGIIEFPDSMTDDEISQAIRKSFFTDKAGEQQTEPVEPAATDEWMAGGVSKAKAPAQPRVLPKTTTVPPTQVTPEWSAGGVSDAPEPYQQPADKPREFTVTPYQKADIESMRRGLGKAQTGMEAGTEFTTALAAGALQPGESIPEIAAGVAHLNTELNNILRGRKPGTPEHVEADISGTANSIKRVFTAVGSPMVNVIPPLTEEQIEAARDLSVSDQRKLGAYNTLASTVNFFTSPLGIATLGMGRLPLIAQRAVAGAFALQMGMAVPELAKALGDELGKPEAQRDQLKIANLITEAAVTTGFTLAGGHKAFTPARIQRINGLANALRNAQLRGEPSGAQYNALVQELGFNPAQSGDRFLMAERGTPLPPLQLAAEKAQEGAAPLTAAALSDQAATPVKTQAEANAAELNKQLTPPAQPPAITYEVVGLDGNTYGPVSAAQIAEWRAQNRVQDNQPIRRTGETGFTPVGQHPDFAKAQEPAPAKKGTPDAEAIREDTGRVQEAGQAREGSQEARRDDVEQAAPKQPEPVEPGKEGEAKAEVAPTPDIQNVRPAIGTMDGDLVEGEKGASHNDTIEANKLTTEDIDRRTYVDTTTKEEVPPEKLAEMGLPTAAETGKPERVDRVHSDTLAEVQETDAVKPSEVAAAPKVDDAAILSAIEDRIQEFGELYREQPEKLRQLVDNAVQDNIRNDPRFSEWAYKVPSRELVRASDELTQSAVDSVVAKVQARFKAEADAEAAATAKREADWKASLDKKKQEEAESERRRKQERDYGAIQREVENTFGSGFVNADTYLSNLFKELERLRNTRQTSPFSGKEYWPEAYQNAAKKVEQRIQDLQGELDEVSKRLSWSQVERPSILNLSDESKAKIAKAKEPPAAAPEQPAVESVPEGGKTKTTGSKADFETLARAQRDKPEKAMLRIQKTQISQLYGWAAEHIGDLTHRMAKDISQSRGMYETVKDKVEKVLRDLKSGFERSVNDQIASNVAFTRKNSKEAKRYGIPVFADAQQAKLELKKLGKAYADEHSQLPVINEVQKVARDAAVALGEFRFDDAKEALLKISDWLEEGREAWEKRASEGLIDEPEKPSVAEPTKAKPSVTEEANKLYSEYLKSVLPKGVKPEYGLDFFIDQVKKQRGEEKKPATSKPTAAESVPLDKPIAIPDWVERDKYGLVIAGSKGLKPVEPVRGMIALRPDPDTGMESVKLIKQEGDFDGRPIWKFQWLSGSEKGRTDSSYIKSYWQIDESQKPSSTKPPSISAGKEVTTKGAEGDKTPWITKRNQENVDYAVRAVRRYLKDERAAGRTPNWEDPDLWQEIWGSKYTSDWKKVADKAGSGAESFYSEQEQWLKQAIAQVKEKERPGGEPKLPPKYVQAAIDSSLRNINTIQAQTKKGTLEKALINLRTMATKLGIEVPSPGTYFSVEEYRRLAGDAMVAIGKKYGEFPTESLRAKRDAAIAEQAASKERAAEKRGKKAPEEPGQLPAEGEKPKRYGVAGLTNDGEIWFKTYENKESAERDYSLARTGGHKRIAYFDGRKFASDQAIQDALNKQWKPTTSPEPPKPAAEAGKGEALPEFRDKEHAQEIIDMIEPMVKAGTAKQGNLDKLQRAKDYLGVKEDKPAEPSLAESEAIGRAQGSVDSFVRTVITPLEQELSATPKSNAVHRSRVESELRNARAAADTARDIFREKLPAKELEERVKGLLMSQRRELPIKYSKPKPVAETKAAAPQQAVAKIEQEVKAVAETQGQAPAKQVKAELIKRVEDEISQLSPLDESLNVQQVGPRTINGKKEVEFRAFPGDTIKIRQERDSNTYEVYGTDYYTPEGEKSPVPIRQTLAEGLDLKQAKALAEKTLRDNAGQFPWRTDKLVQREGGIGQEIKINWNNFTGKTGKPKTISIDIPGDGEFTVVKSHYALDEMLRRVKAIQIKPETEVREIPKAPTKRQEEVRSAAVQAEQYYKTVPAAIAAFERQLKSGEFDPEQRQFSNEVLQDLYRRLSESERTLKTQLERDQKSRDDTQKKINDLLQYQKQYPRDFTRYMQRDLAQAQKDVVKYQQDATESAKKLADFYDAKAKMEDALEKEPAAQPQPMPQGPGAPAEAPPVIKPPVIEKGPGIAPMGGDVAEAAAEQRKPFRMAAAVAVLDRDRAEMGKPPMADAVVKSDPELAAQVEARINEYRQRTNGGDYAEDLMARYREGPFPPTDVEVLALVLKRIEMKNAYNRADAELGRIDKEMNPDAYEAQRGARDAISDMILDLDGILGKGDAAMGTMQGRAFRARQLAYAEDFSFAGLMADATKRKGRKLSEKEEALLRKIADDYKRTRTRIDEESRYLDAERRKLLEKSAEGEWNRIEQEALRRELSNVPRFAKAVLDRAEQLVSSYETRTRANVDAALAWFRGEEPPGTPPGQMPAMSGFPGVPPQVLRGVIEWGAGRIMRASLSAAEFTAEAIGRFGERVRPLLENNWLFERSTEETQTTLRQEPAPVRTAVSRRVRVQRDARQIIDTATQRIQDTVGDFPAEQRETAYRNLPPEQRNRLYEQVKRLGRAYVSQGLRGWRQISDAITRDMRERIRQTNEEITRRNEQIQDPAQRLPLRPDWDAKDTVDLMGIAPYKALSRAEIDVEWRKARGEAREVRNIQKIISGRPGRPPGSVAEPRVPSGPEFPKPEDAQRRYRQILEEQKRRYPEANDDAARRLQSSLDRQKVYTRNRIADAQWELENQQRIVRQRTAPPTDAELESLRQELDNLREIEKVVFADQIEQANIRRAITAAERNERIMQERLERARRGVYDVETGTRRRPTSTELDAIQARTEALRDQIEELKAADVVYQEQLRTDALNKSITELSERLEYGPLFPDPKKAPFTSPTLEPLERRRLELLQQLREAQKNSPEAILRAEEKAMAVQEELKRRIEEGDIAKRERATGPTSERLEQIRSENALLNRTIAELRAKARSMDELMTLRDEQIQKKIDYFKDKVQRGDISTKKRPEPLPQTKKSIELNYELKQIHDEWMKLRAKDKLAGSDVDVRIHHSIGNFWRFVQMMMTTGEFSMLRKQGGVATFTNPVIWARAMKPGFKALFSGAEAQATSHEIMTRSNAPLYKQAGLEFTDLGQKLSTMEEYFAVSYADWLKKVDPNAPFLKRMGQHVTSKTIAAAEAFQRSFTTYLNTLRADIFDALTDFYGTDSTTAKVAANWINVMSGRGSTGIGKHLGPALSNWFFAPRWAVSRFQMYGQPISRAFFQDNPYGKRVHPDTLEPNKLWGAESLWRGNEIPKKMMLAQYGKMIASVGTLLGLAMAAGVQVELDPRSSDFGKLRFGNRRLDIWAGMQQPLVFMSRLATGKYKDLQGKMHPMSMGIIGNFLRYKTSPMISNAISARLGKTPDQKPYNWKTFIKQSFVPITYNDIVQATIDAGMPKNIAEFIVNVWLTAGQVAGESLQTIQPDVTKAPGAPRPPRPPRP